MKKKNRKQKTGLTEEDIVAFGKEACKSKETARAVLIAIGVIDEKGELTEPYRPSEDALSYRYS